MNEVFTCGTFQDMMEKTSMDTVMTTVTTLGGELGVVNGSQMVVAAYWLDGALLIVIDHSSAQAREL